MIVDSPEAMIGVGRDLASRLAEGDMVALYGGLGAGKTMFCRGVLAGLGYAGDVPSPTFTIAQHYVPPEVTRSVIHADLYRLNDPDELTELGLFEGDSIRLVEWAEKGGPALKKARFMVDIRRLDDMRREVTIKEND
jgi:tRNA threonylcarbamoyladenosine biosynthesis protein TsaE